MNAPSRLLHNLVSMSGMRDQELLEVSLLKTVQRLQDMKQVSLLVLAPNGEVQTETSYSPGKCTINNANVTLSAEIQSLLAVLDHGHAEYVSASQSGEGITVFQAHSKRRQGVFLVVHSKVQLSRSERMVIQALIEFYRNFCDLLMESQIDALTSLRNRKTFDEVFARYQLNPVTEYQPDVDEDHIEKRAPKNVMHWVVMVDVDHFKSINDTMGHLFGDEILILLAHQLKKSLRAHDDVFRFGGEEFVLIIQCQSLGEARDTLDRIRQGVQDMPTPRINGVTVSVGATQITPETFSGTLLDYADKALYHSKAQGRNRVTFFEDLVEQGLAEYEKPPEDSIDYF